jgi:hypothetical protein
MDQYQQNASSEYQYFTSPNRSLNYYSSYLSTQNDTTYSSTPFTNKTNYDYPNYLYNYDQGYYNNSYSYDQNTSSYPYNYYSNCYLNNSYTNNYDSAYLTYHDTSSETSQLQNLASPAEKKSKKRQRSEVESNPEPVVEDKESLVDHLFIEETEQIVQTVSKRPRVFKLENIETKTQHCKICSIDFESLSKYLMHQHKFHNNGNPNQCPICFKMFNNQANTLVHLRVHTDEKTYKCKYCNAGFCDSSTLKKHIRTHTNEKPYKCHLCTKSFTQSGNLKRHILVHEKYDYYPLGNFSQDQENVQQNNVQQETVNHIQNQNYECNFTQNYY